MTNSMKFYIDGKWVDPIQPHPANVINPATEEVVGQISYGSAEDLNRAVKAARAAFPAFSQISKRKRLGLLRRIVAGFEARADELAHAITIEMGAPITFSRRTQVAASKQPFEKMIEVVQTYKSERRLGNSVIRREPIGVCGLITPWNWPLYQITVKLASALAAGCTVVVKPSELAPLSPILLAEILHDAGVPRGVFNLVNGDGPTVGDAISRHPDIDMVSFTGSTRAGILVAKAAAETVKRVAQELGGKSANIVLPDADLPAAVKFGVLATLSNSGQSCQAPTRMLVHKDQRDQILTLAKATAEGFKVGDTLDPNTRMGPLVSKAQFDKVQAMIQSGLDEGATLVCGGAGRPSHLNRGYYVRPTIFADVQPQMRIAKEEIFGPVLSIMTYDSDDEAVALANDTLYGLAGYVHSTDAKRARSVAERIRAGRVYVNGAMADAGIPFGGYKQSGNGRELGVFGFEEYLEVKAIVGTEL